jgi:hypothetical protein
MSLHPGFCKGGLALLLMGAFLAPPACAGEIDRYLPEDTEIFVSVNVRQVVSSDLFKKYGLDDLRDALKNIDRVEDILKDLGFDPFRDLERVLLASPGGADQDKGLAIVHGQFDLAKFKAKAEEALRDHPEALKLHKVPNGAGGQFLVYEVTAPDPDTPLFVALASKNTLLASWGKDYVVDALKKAPGKAAPALKNKDMQALLEKMDLKQSVALAAVGKALTKGALPWDEAAKAFEKVDALGGGLTLGDDVKVEVVISAKTEEDAREFKNAAERGVNQALTVLAVLATAQKEFNPALEIVKSVKVTARGKIVSLKGQINADVIEDAFKK